MGKPHVLVTHPRGWFPFMGPLLEEKFHVQYWKDNWITKKQLVENVKGKFGIVCVSRLLIDEEVIKAAGKSLKVVCIHSSGFENIDVKALKNHGIKVGYMGPTNVEATAEFAVTLLLSVSRRIKEFIRTPDYFSKRTSLGNRTEILSHGLQNSTVGIIGCGLIGTSVAKKLKPFSIKRLMYFARSEKPEVNAIGGEFHPLHDVIKESDFTVVSLSSNKDTYKIISKDLIKQMKPTSILVNVGRGELIDQDALTEALQLGKIAGAGLDVTTPEPLPLEHPLHQMDNVVISPHVGAGTFEAFRQADQLAAANLFAVLEGKEMPMEL